MHLYKYVHFAHTVWTHAYTKLQTKEDGEHRSVKRRY